MRCSPSKHTENYRRKSGLFTKNSKKAIELIKNVKANKIFVNTYPFENYEFEFDEKKLLIKKQIINLSVILRKNIMIKILKKLYIYLEFIVNG